MFPTTPLRAAAPLAVLTLSFAALAWACAPEGDGIDVGVTLQDGQVLVGDVRTEMLQLETGFGLVDVPLIDVGMVVPVEATRLADANDQVTVWLRNGSELRGRWLEPELAMEISVGGQRVAVELPADDLQALQLRGSEDWPSGDLYRVRTTHGDDFLVDASRTRLVLQNELGTFSPYLSEAAVIQPLGDPTGPWRIELHNGTILVGGLVDEQLDFVLPMGPEEVTLPLELFVSMSQEQWAPDPEVSVPADEDVSYQQAARRRSLYKLTGYSPPSPPQAATPALKAEEGWFDNQRLYQAKH